MANNNPKLHKSSTQLARRYFINPATLAKLASWRPTKTHGAKRKVRKLTAQGLMLLLCCSMVPAAVRQTTMQYAVSESKRTLDHARKKWIDARGVVKPGNPQDGSMPPRLVNPPGITPEPVETRAHREARVAAIRINTGAEVLLQSRQTMSFVAVPLASDGSPIHGLQAEWRSSNRHVVQISRQGQAIAGRPGDAILTAQAGSARTTVHAIVSDRSLDQSGGQQKQGAQPLTSHPDNKATLTGTETRFLNHTNSGRAARLRIRPAVTMTNIIYPPPHGPGDDPLPDNQTNSLYQAANAVGSPPGKTIPGAQMPSAAVDGTENPGSQNFTFEIPIATPPGRGLNLELALAHNSQLFNRSVDPANGVVHMTYDVDSGWPAAGFRLGYGQIENQSSYGFTLTDPDGTRHALTATTTGEYDCTDGTSIHYSGGPGSGILYYADGTQVTYGAGGNGYRIYPTQITDRNGNFIRIAYVGGVGPRIASIQDTLQRYVNFYYAANGDLVTITAPGLSGQAERALMRFYYQDLALAQTGLFQAQISVSAPTSVRVIKYIYLPNSVELNNAHVGYRFDYSAYGMMYQMTKFRGISASWNTVTDPGQYPTEGANTIAAVTSYNYQGTPLRSIPAGGLSDAPDYTQRIDDWAGRVSAQPVYQFSVDKASGVSTVTAPDGIVTETQTIVNAGQWNDGLLSDVYIDKQGASFLSHTKVDWEVSPAGEPRISQKRITDDAGQTKATLFSYTSYNNIASVSERDFTSDPNASGAELRRTETTYQTSQSYVDRHILHLPLSVRVFAGQSATPAARVDYAYDNYGSAHANLTRRDDIEMHDPAFDPFQQSIVTNCQWVCKERSGRICIDWEWVCTQYNPYQSATDYRGNLTSVTTYTDAAAGAGPVTHATTYDIAGNVTSTEVDCCQLKSYSYASSFDYAYPTGVTSGPTAGPNLTQTASYDLNTGLTGALTDENGQVTTNFYNADSLRLNHTDYPNGGATYLYYNDALWPDSTGRTHYYSNRSTRVDANNWMDFYSFYDGRGQVAQTFFDGTASGPWNSQVFEYDVMGRAYRYTNPFATGGYGGGLHLDGPLTTRAFDHLGRLTQVTSPSGDDTAPTTTTATYSYSGSFTTVTDQALKPKRQKVDALGRLVRLDEPNTAGDLGPTNSPSQPTNYEYDVLDNLIHVAQPGPTVTQHRYFRFDSLSRLTHERHVEEAAPWTTTDAVAGNNQWSRKIIYNSQSLVQDAFDARQINTHFTYDGLNRVSKIEYFLANGTSPQGTPTRNYFYDQPRAGYFNLGRLTEQSTAAVTGVPATVQHFDYDAMGQIKSQRQTIGATNYLLSYAYNLAGQPTSETYPGNRVLTNAYGYAGRLTSISDGTTTFANAFSFVPSGGLASETWGNGAVHTIGYNRALQPGEIKLRNLLGAELQRYNYVYGKFNQTTGAFETTRNNGQIGRIEGFTNGAKQWEQRFVYDALARLTDAAEYRGDNGTRTYAAHYDYDRFGNRFQYQNNVNVNYIPVQPADINPANNRFLATGATPVVYDNNSGGAGNITSDAKFRSASYVYDASNRQISATSGNVTQTSVYDAAGQRVQTTENGVTRTRVFDIFGQNIADYTGATGGTLERENIFRAGQLLASQTFTQPRANFALAANGGVATASSYFSNPSYGTYPPGSVNDGARTSLNNSIWLDNTYGTFPDWVQVDFSGTRTIDEIDIVTQQDNNQNPSEPTLAQTFTNWGITAFTVQYWNGSGWVTITGGNVTGNNKVWRQFSFPSISTSKIRLTVNDSSDHLYSRVVEVEAWGAAVAGTGPITYVLQDLQGSARAAMNNFGASSTVTMRHDYLPFGEEIGAGVGLRTAGQGFGVSDGNRQKYALVERDDVTGLDHARWRKYESRSGRWTSADPYNGSLDPLDPQTLNRYAYVGNDAPNRLDPSGLICWDRYLIVQTRDQFGTVIAEERRFLYTHCDFSLSLVPIGGWDPQGRTENVFNPKATDEYNRKEIQRRIDAGNRWEQWRQWEACAAPLTKKAKANWRDAFDGFLAQEAMLIITSTAAIGGGGGSKPVSTTVGVGGGAMNLHLSQKRTLDSINSNWLRDAEEKCGPRVTKPSGHN